MVQNTNLSSLSSFLLILHLTFLILHFYFFTISIIFILHFSLNLSCLDIKKNKTNLKKIKIKHIFKIIKQKLIIQLITINYTAIIKFTFQLFLVILNNTRRYFTKQVLLILINFIGFGGDLGSRECLIGLWFSAHFLI